MTDNNQSSKGGYYLTRHICRTQANAVTGAHCRWALETQRACNDNNASNNAGVFLLRRLHHNECE